MITAGLAISGGLANTYFVLYYPALAMFAVVFTSFRLSLSVTTMVAIVYAVLSLRIEPGVDFDIQEEKVLFTRILVMYAVVVAVNLVPVLGAFDKDKHFNENYNTASLDARYTDRWLRVTNGSVGHVPIPASGVLIPIGLALGMATLGLEAHSNGSPV